MEQRIKKIKDFLGENQALLVVDGANRFYFTGFNSSAGALLITRSGAFFLIDFRYYEKAKAVIKSAKVVLCTKLYSQIDEILLEEKIGTLFIESETLSFTTYNNLCQKLSAKISTDNTLQGIITLARSVKDSTEIEAIKKAQRLTDETFEYILNSIRVGKTERQIALDMEFFMRKNGSDGVAFNFVVVSGKNSSLPHGVPTNKTLEKGDFITMDFGAMVNGYRSDMTRTVALKEVTDKQKLVYDTVLKAQLESMKSIKAGAVCKSIDAIARNIINTAGFEGCFGHGLGHSVGVEIHESPAFNTRDETVLKSGMVMTVEPGIYIENEFGVRIEDMVVVTDDGFENLTNSPKELIIL